MDRHPPLPSFGKFEPSESMNLVLSETVLREEDRPSSPMPFQFGFQAPSPLPPTQIGGDVGGDGSSLSRRDTSLTRRDTTRLLGNIVSSPASSFRLQRMASTTMRGGNSRMGSMVDLGASAREESRSLSPLGRRGVNTTKASSAALRGGGGARRHHSPNHLNDLGGDITSLVSSPNLLRGGMQIPKSYTCYPGSEPLEVDAVGCVEPERLMVVHGTMFDEETTMENRIEATMGSAAIAERAAKRNKMRNVPVMNRARRVKRNMMASVIIAHAIFALQIEASRNLAKARGTLIRLLVPIIAKRRFVRERMRRRYMIQSDAFSNSQDGAGFGSSSGGLPDRPTPEDLARAVPMFAMLGRYPGVLPALINEMECLAFDEAEHIIRQGESSSNLYFVARGTCVERAVVRNARKTTGGGWSSTTPQKTTAVSPAPTSPTTTTTTTTAASAPSQVTDNNNTPVESKPTDTDLPSAHALSPARAYNLNGGRRNSIVAAQTASFNKVRGSRSSLLTLGRSAGGVSTHESLTIPPPLSSTTQDGFPPPRSRSHSLSGPSSRRLSAANTTPPTSTTVPVKSFPIPSDNRLLLYGGVDGDGVATASGGALIESSTSVFTGYASPVRLQPTERTRNTMGNALSTGTLRGTSTGNMLATLATVGKAIGKFLHNRTTQMYEGAKYGSGAVFGSVFGIPIAHSCSIVVTSPEAACWMLSHDAFQRIIFGSMAGTVGFCREIVSVENAPTAKGTDIHARLGALHAAKTTSNTNTTTSPSTLLMAAIASSTVPVGGPRPPTTSNPTNASSPSPRRAQLLLNNSNTMNPNTATSHSSPRLSSTGLQHQSQHHPQLVDAIAVSSDLVPPEAISELREAYIRQCIATIPLCFPVHLSLTTVRKVPYWNELETPSQLLPHFVNPTHTTKRGGGNTQMTLMRGPTVRGVESTSPAAEAAHASVSGGKWLDGFHLGKLTPVVFEKGDHLYKAGVHCPFVYLLLAGEVQLVQDDVPWRGIVLGEEEATGTPFNPLGSNNNAGGGSPHDAPSSPLLLPNRRDHSPNTTTTGRLGAGRSSSPRATSTHHRAWSPNATHGGGRTAPASPDATHHNNNGSPHNQQQQQSPSHARTSNIAVGSLLRLSRTKAFIWLGHHAAILPEIPQHTCVATSDIVKVYAMDRLHFLDTLVEEPGLLGRVRDEMLQARASKLLFRSLHWFNYAPLLSHVPSWARADYVAKGIRPRVIAPGTIIANQFDTVKYMYFVASGTVRILPRIHSTTRVLNEPPLASWHPPLPEPSNPTTMASHSQRRKAASYQDEAEVTMLLNPTSSHIIVPPVILSDDGSGGGGGGGVGRRSPMTSPRRTSGRRVSDRVPHTVSKAAATSPPTTCSPDLQCSWFDIDGPYLHTLLPPSSKLLRPRPAVGTTPHCTSLLQAAAQAAQVAQAREAGSASPPNRGGRGTRNRSPTLDATINTVMWNSPDKTRGNSIDAPLLPHTTTSNTNSPELTSLHLTNSNTVHTANNLVLDTSNEAFPAPTTTVADDVVDVSSSLVQVSSGARRISQQELVGGTQYPSSIIGYLNPRQAQTLRHLLAEEEAMAAVVAKTVAPIKYVLGGTWEGLIADKWADTYEAASVVELWEVPIEGLRTAFEKGACVSRGAMVEAARKQQMMSVGLEVPLSAPLPPLLPSQRVLSNAGLTRNTSKHKESTSNGVSGAGGFGRFGATSESTRKRGLSTATVSDGTSSEAAAFPLETTTTTTTTPPVVTETSRTVEGNVLNGKSSAVFNDSTGGDVVVANGAHHPDVGITAPAAPKIVATDSESPAAKPPTPTTTTTNNAATEPSPQSPSTTTTTRSALPPRGGGPSRPTPTSPSLQTNRPPTTPGGGANGMSGSGRGVRSGSGEAVRVRRGSTLDGILCDGIEDLLDPTGASSLNVGRVVSVNIEDTAVCGGSGRLDDAGGGRGGMFEVSANHPHRSNNNNNAAASMSYRSNPSRSWWSDPHDDEPSMSIRPEDIEVDESLKKNGLLNPAAMLKQLHEEKIAEEKRIEDAKRAKLSALQHQLTARAMEGARLKKKRYGTSNHSDELARRRLEVSLDMELEQRKLAWEEKKREERLIAGLVKPRLRATQDDDDSSSPLLTSTTTVPFSPMRLRTNVVLPTTTISSTPRHHHQGGDLSPSFSNHHHQPSPPLNPQSSYGSFNSSAASPGRNYSTTTTYAPPPPSTFTLQKSVHQSNSSHTTHTSAADAARLPLPPGLEGMCSPSSSSPGRKAAVVASGPSHSRRPAGGSLRGKATITTSSYVPPPTTSSHISPRSMSSKSASSPHGGLASLGVRLPHAAL